MPTGKVKTVDDVLGPLKVWLEKRSPDARAIVIQVLQKEVNRMNAKGAPSAGKSHKAKAKAKPGPKPKAAKAAAPAAPSQFEAAKGTKAPKKKAKKVKPQTQPAGGGENSAGEGELDDE